MNLIQQTVKTNKEDSWRKSIGDLWLKSIRELPWKDSMSFDLLDYLKNSVPVAKKIVAVWNKLGKNAVWKNNHLDGTLTERFAVQYGFPLVQLEVGSFMFNWCLLILEDVENKTKPTFKYYKLGFECELFTNELKSELIQYTGFPEPSQQIYKELKQLLP